MPSSRPSRFPCSARCSRHAKLKSQPLQEAALPRPRFQAGTVTRTGKAVSLSHQVES